VQKEVNKNTDSKYKIEQKILIIENNKKEKEKDFIDFLDKNKKYLTQIEQEIIFKQKELQKFNKIKIFDKK